MTTYYTTLDSPVGRLLLTSDGKALTRMHFNSDGDAQPEPDWVRDDTGAPLADAVRQLGEFFAGNRTQFDLPLAAEGTEFQRRVWDELRAIPYGETISYAELAQRIGNPKASRAVGMANSRNPIGIIVPCHRVIGANGSLTGFAGGLGNKRRLLELEQKRTGLGI